MAGQIVLEVQAWGAPEIGCLGIIEYLGGLASKIMRNHTITSTGHFSRYSLSPQFLLHPY